MRVELKRTDDSFKMEAKAENGKTLVFDGSLAIGGHDAGVSPMQSLLMAMGACSAIDVIMILKKQKQDLKDIQISIDGEREPGKEPSLWKKVHAHFKLFGPIEHDKAERAIGLSMDKYCSVAATLRAAGAEITHEFSIHP